MQKPKHILWLPTGGQIGDALMALSALAEFLEREPEGRVTYLARRNATIIADLARAYPRIQVVPIPKNPFNAFALIVRLFVSGRYVVIVPPTPGTHPKEIKSIATLFRCMPGNRVVGMLDRGSWQPYTHTVVYDTALLNINNLRHELHAGGIETASDNTPPSLRLEVQLPQNISLPHAYIAIHPFPTLQSKTLPMHRWSSLLLDFAKQYPDLSFVVTGSKENEPAAKEMTLNLPRTQLAINLPILEVAGIIQNSALYISVDTGITHLAGVMNHKSVVLAQRSSPTWLPTYNPNAKVLLNTSRCTCDNAERDCFVEEDGQRYYKCLYDITDEAIFTASKDFVSR